MWLMNIVDDIGNVVQWESFGLDATVFDSISNWTIIDMIFSDFLDNFNFVKYPVLSKVMKRCDQQSALVNQEDGRKLKKKQRKKTVI